MKYLLVTLIACIIISLMYTNCGFPTQKNVLILPSDSLVKAQLIKYFTQQNELDGAEFATVDTLFILNKILSTDEQSVDVTYHIHCSYQPAALPLDAQRDPPPPLNTTVHATFIYHKNAWILQEDQATIPHL
jgi:hypothetical protein